MGTRNFLLIKAQFDVLHKTLLNRALFGKMVGVVGSALACVFCVFGFIARYILRFIGSDRGEDSVFEEESVSSANKYEFFSLKGINGFVEEPKVLSLTVQELYLDSNDVVPNSRISETVEAAKEKAEEFPVHSNEISQRQEHDDQADELSEKSKVSGLSVPETFLGSEEFTVRYNEVAQRQEQDDQADDFEGQEEELSENFEALTRTVPEIFLGSEEFTFRFPRTRERDDQAEEFMVNSKALIYSVPKTFLGSEKLTINYDEIAQFQEYGDQAEPFARGEEELSEKTESPSQKLDSEHDCNGCSDEKEAPNIAGEETLLDSDKFTIQISEQDDQVEDSPEEPNSLSFTIFDDKIVREKDDQAEDRSSPSREEEDDDIIIDPHGTEPEEEYIELEPRKEEKKKCESEWEHDDVIEQLKWELRKARAGGLATIMEEESDSDSPAASPVGPTKVDLSLKFGYKESMEEIQKVHKSYAERMKKLDILNTQTMHAIGFLQLKHQLKPPQKRKKTFLPRRAQKDDDPELKFAGKLQNDFELVYVGQICLSWEVLRWQQRKLRDHSCLQNDVARRYNLVASEFQLFRVLIQRFVEDESFRGPRVQNYAKSRCVVRSLVQVPIVRDDFAKDKQYILEGDEDSVSCERLSRVIVEAMFAFWDFIRRDEKINVGVRVSKETVIGEPVDSRLLMDIKRDFQKKERRVKEIERSGNCVVKKLQKWHKEEEKHKQREDEDEEEEEKEDFWPQRALFLAQVELRLVSRVLSMSTLTRDRLLWCQHKLNQITFSNRKLHFEPSFLLFPC